MRWVAEDDEPAVVPGAVVAEVDEEEVFDEGELRGGGGGGPQGEVGDEPLPVGPDVVVLGVFGEHAGEEGELVGWQGGELRHDGLAVVPARRRGLVVANGGQEPQQREQGEETDHIW